MPEKISPEATQADGFHSRGQCATRSFAIIRIAVGLMLGTAACLTHAQEVLITGSVERIALLPSGTAECPAACPQMFTPLPDGQTRVCISNYCGCQVTDIKVDKVLLGQVSPGVFQVKSRLGEWCRPTFPISTAPLLVQVKDGTPHWSPLDSKQGVPRFNAKPFTSIGKVRIDSLNQADGKVLLEDLVNRLAD